MHTLLSKRKAAYLFSYKWYTVWVYVYTVHTFIRMSICLSVHLIKSTKQILHKKLMVGQLVKKLPALTVLILTTFLTIKLKASFIGHLYTMWQTVECQHFLTKGRHKTGNSTKSFKSLDFFLLLAVTAGETNSGIQKSTKIQPRIILKIELFNSEYSEENLQVLSE